MAGLFFDLSDTVPSPGVRKQARFKALQCVLGTECATLVISKGFPTLKRLREVTCEAQGCSGIHHYT